MDGKEVRPRAVAASVAIYRLLLVAYPAAFRAEYGNKMVRVFQDMLGAPGRTLPGLWSTILLDTLRAGLKERSEEMGRSTLPLVGAAIAAGLAIA